MTDYLQRLIKRLDRPAQIDSWPPRLTPFISGPRAGDAPHEAFEEVNEMSPAEEPLLDRPSRIDPGMGPTYPSLANPSVFQPIEMTPAAPPSFTRDQTELPLKGKPMLPDLPATETSLHTDEGSFPIATEDSEQQPSPSRIILTEKEKPYPSSPEAGKSFPAVTTGNPPDLSIGVQHAPHRRTPAEKPTDRETPIAPIAPIASDSLAEPIDRKQRQLKGEPAPGGRKPSETQAGLSPPPPMGPGLTPTLNPTPAPPPPGIPQADPPRLVIGRLQVEVVSASAQASPPAASPAKPIRRAPSPTPVRAPLRSKLRFGIGQL